MNRIESTLLAHAITTRVCATGVELAAYAELALLAGQWRKRNTAERVANALKVDGAEPLTES